jgi:tRNA-specific 2-thiouridylase
MDALLQKAGQGLDGLARGDRVVVAMSGGVDSSVTAALCQARGLDVVGVTLQLYDHGRAIGRKGACCAGTDIMDARGVAERLGIPHYVLDYEARFRQAVIDDFADGYLAGETPSPCIRCNQRIKFRDLLGTARDLGAQALVTGHYARRVAGRHGPELHRAADTIRDQSYFLFATRRQELEYLRFPLGGLATKAEVRQLAHGFGLDVAEKPDSQDICFVAGGRYAETIERLRPGAGRPGEIVDETGRVLGRHRGIAHYTVGQRRGLAIAAEAPLYVLAIDVEANRLLVGPRRSLAETRFRLRDLNWLDFAAGAEAERQVEAKIRSTRPAVAATVRRMSDGGADGSAEVRLDTPEEAVAPGQACVLYDGARVLGGGWIARPAQHRAGAERAA